MQTLTSDDEHAKARVSKEMEDAKALAKTLNLEEVSSGEWFIKLLPQVGRAYDRNVTAAYFQKKYPGLSRDEIADILTSITAKYATIAGAVAGLAASANEIAAMGSGGLTLPLFLGSISAEMVYLWKIQMRLVLDLSILYDLRLDLEDPEDILLVFGYALGVAPTDLLSKRLLDAARAGAPGAIRQIFSKGMLDAVQRFGQRIGLKILQRSIIKYAVPIASAAVGSSYNYIATKSVGRIAKIHFKNRGRVTDELRAVISKRDVYDLVVPAAVLFMAQVDGSVSPKEKELYRAMLSRMSFEEHSPADFERLISEEQSILDGVSQIEDAELRKALIELLTLMAIYDGILANEERGFLANVSDRLGVSLDIAQVEERAEEYRVIVEKNLPERTAVAMGSAAAAVMGRAGHTAGLLKAALGKAVNRQDRGKTSRSPAATQVDPVD